MNKKKSETHSHNNIENALAALKNSGLKLTKPRQAILQALTDSHGPFSAEDLHKIVSKRVCDLATIYRSLASLEEAGIIRRCEFGDGTARYEIINPDGSHHHHLICNKCGRVEILDEEELEEVDRIAIKHGYSNVTHILEFFGICPKCKESKN